MFKARALNRPSATKYHAAFAMLQQLQRGDSRARALNTTKDSYAALRVHFQGDRITKRALRNLHSQIVRSDSEPLHF